MTLLCAAACFLILLITTTHGLSFDAHHDHASNVWNHHSIEESFLTLWNLSLKACVEKCQLLNACRAVNYCRTRRSCQLLETDSGVFVTQNVTEEFNVFVRMSDARLSPQLAQALAACNCTVNQTCLLNTSSCIVTECRKLNVANGVIMGNMVNVGSRVKVVCNDLYKLDNVSQDQSVCQAEGQWLPSITCVPDTACGPPQSVTAATFVRFTNVSNVINAVYECDAGYDTPSDFNVMSVVCLSATLAWGTVGFECLAACGAPPNVTLATVSAGDNLHGFTKFYTCDAGHAVNGSANITCQADATWSQIQFECIANCGAPPAVPNGVVLPGDTVEESVRNYTCNTGYAPNSMSTLVTCQMDGNWTVVEFACIIDCGTPPTINNTEVSVGGTSEGNNRIYTCSTGHVFRNLVTENTTCQSDGTWSKAKFDCLWDCGPAPTVQNAAVTVSDTVEASVGTYTCNTGFVANDTTKTTITCQAGATWSDIVFYCVVDCGEPAAITNADVSTGGTLEGDVRTYSCTVGHVLRNLVNVDITCEPSRTWSTASFDCLWDCGSPPTVANATVATGDTVQNTDRGYSCDTGYAAVGTTIITCLAGSTWTDVAFTCDVDCATPPTESNAVVGSGGTTEGLDRTYTCNSGYQSNATTMTITCQSTGLWTPAMFTCLIDCGTPSNSPKVVVTGVGTLDGDTQTYSCVSGYVLRNVVTVETTCQSDGTWSTPSFDCFWDCGTAPIKLNADVAVCDDTVESSVCTYTCSAGYAADGAATITCQAEASWTTTSFTCEVDCGPPASILNTQIDGGGTGQGVTRTYSCTSNYVMSNLGTADITCQTNSTWTTPSFNCLWDCGSPPTMAFGTVSGGDSLVGSSMFYTCVPGYGTTGTATISCLDGIGWSAPTSSCTELVCDTGWHRIGESCYFMTGTDSDFRMNVFDARDICHSYNAYIVQLETQSEADAVEFWFFNAYSIIIPWIGITDTENEGTWVWMNSSLTTNWTDWDTSDNNPNGGSSDNFCRLRLNGQWTDRPWSDNAQPVCEKSVQPATSP